MIGTKIVQSFQNIVIVVEARDHLCFCLASIERVA